MQVIDWDDALDNRGYIDGIEALIERNAERAAAFRAEQQTAGRAVLALPYGAEPRERLDLFRPGPDPAGLLVFVHGGYWRSFDRTDWSHLAKGALDRGFAVAMPGYTLCPEGSVPKITRQVARAIEHAAGLVAGPIRLIGHSAGGQVVTRLVAEPTVLSPGLIERIVRVVSISGVHDLAPILEAALNDDLNLDEAQVEAESPARLTRPADLPVTAWVGGGERPEFLRQSAMLAERWHARLVVDPERNHFDVVEGLCGGPLLDEVLG